MKSDWSEEKSSSSFSSSPIINISVATTQPTQVFVNCNRSWQIATAPDKLQPLLTNCNRARPKKTTEIIVLIHIICEIYTTPLEPIRKVELCSAIVYDSCWTCHPPAGALSIQTVSFRSPRWLAKRTLIITVAQPSSHFCGKLFIL